MNYYPTIITVDKDHSEFDYYCNIIEDFCSMLPNDMKKIKNYRSDLKIKESIAVSLYQYDSNILGFSSVLHRSLFGNGVRILNRLIKNFDYRFPNNKRNLTQETITMMSQQIEIAKKYNFDYVFISRESAKDVSALSRYFKILPDWHCPTKRYRVCNGGKQCEQFIAWLPLKRDVAMSLPEIEDQDRC